VEQQAEKEKNKTIEDVQWADWKSSAFCTDETRSAVSK